MASPPLLRPLNHGEMLDEVLDLYRADWLLFFTIVAVIQIPLLLVTWAMGMPRIVPGKLPDPSVFISMAVMGIATVLQSAALLSAASNRYLHRRASLGGAYRYALRRWLPLLAIITIQYLVLALGFMCLLVPGIIFMFWTAFVTPVFILEGTGWGTTWERSRYLAAHQWDRIFLFYLLIILFITTFTLQPTMWTQFLIKSPTLRWEVSQVWGAVSNLFFLPLWALASMVLYYDVRIRKEAFDLQIRAEALASA